VLLKGEVIESSSPLEWGKRRGRGDIRDGDQTFGSENTWATGASWTEKNCSLHSLSQS